MKIQAGDRVMIRNGPFKGLTGTVIRVQGSLGHYLVSHDKSMPGMHSSGDSLPERNGWWYEEDSLQHLIYTFRNDVNFDMVL